MQSVEITRATVAAGRRVNVGEVVELPESQARTLLAMGKAVPIVDAPVADNRDAEVAAKMSKRGAKKNGK
jgi:hypothetical protein